MSVARQRSQDARLKYARRGLARCVLEAEARGDEGYFATHPMAANFRMTDRRRLNGWAREGNPETGTGPVVYVPEGFQPRVMSNADRKRLGVPLDPDLRR